MENLDLEKMNKDLKQPFIADKDVNHVKKVTVETVQETKTFDIEVPAKPTEEYQKAWWNTINKFETKSWEPKRKGLDCGFKSINNAFDGGIKTGFIVIAAESNTGKSAMIAQIATNIATLNNNVYVMDFSLDDPIDDKIPRIVACKQKIPINAVKSPENYTMYPYMLLKRMQGLNDLRWLTDSYRAYDATTLAEERKEVSKGSDIESILEEVARQKKYFTDNNIDKQIVLLIDNFHDLTSRDHPNYQDKQKYDYLAQTVSDAATSFDIPIICTAEFRKLNRNGRPTLDDIREANKIVYEAKAIILGHNDVHSKGEGAQVFFNRKEKGQEKCPIFEAHFAKNKMGSFKGRVYFQSFPELAYMAECDEQTSKYYSSTIMGS